MVNLYTSDKFSEIARKIGMTEDDIMRCGSMRKLEKNRRHLAQESLYLPDGSMGVFFYTDYSLVIVTGHFSGEYQNINVSIRLFYRDDKKFPLKLVDVTYLSNPVKWTKKSESQIMYLSKEALSFMKRISKKANKTDKITSFKFFK